jgi:SAM-dependent methyltransferase
MKCYLCGSHEHELVSERLRYESPRKVYRCLRCGLVYLYPPMGAEEERRFYEQEYGEIFSSEKGTTPEQLFQSRLPEALRYRSWITDLLGDRESCLEIGCASGYFLATIRGDVRSVAGVETHRLLRENCQSRGIPAHETTRELESRSFSRIFAFFVLEHLGDPLEFLAEMQRILEPGGKICLVVPNVEDALLSLYSIPAFRSFYFTPAHQFYYSRSTLSALFGKAGLPRHEISPVQRYDLSNHIHWMTMGKPGGVGKYNHVFTPDLLERYAGVLEDHFLCDTLIARVTGGYREEAPLHAGR